MIKLLLFSILFVIYVNNQTGNYFIEPLLNTSFVSFDLWSLIHLFFSLLLIIVNKKYRSILKYTIVIFGWELAENILCPHLFPDLYYFKETPENIAGDILLALPGYYLLTHKNILNKIDITIHRFLKFDVS